LVFFKPKKQTMEGYYEVNINFEEASKEWNKNKKRVDQSYIYICGLTTTNRSILYLYLWINNEKRNKLSK